MKQIQEDVSYIERTNVSSNNVAIDAENVGFITSLLTTKLYSKPIHAFFREIVSNGYDAQIEAGTNEPLIITLQRKKDNSIGVSIRDFGTGISPERFNEIFLFLGSSTKRDSNEYIGQLGVGRFATLAVANIVHMTSYYNNRIYYYAMYRTDQSICIDKIYEEDSVCRNGFEVEVDIPYKYSLADDIYNAIEQLAFFDGVYINDINVDSYKANKFNQRKIFKHSLYAAQEDMYISETKILYGNVIYDIGDNVRTILNDYFQTTRLPILMRFDIGELDINPNRESLLYNDRTVKAITNKVKALYAHFQTILQQQSYTCDNLLEARLLYKHRGFVVDLKKYDNAPLELEIPRSAFTSIQLKCNINGINIDSDLIDWIDSTNYEYNINIDCVLHQMYNEKFMSHFSFSYLGKSCIYYLEQITNHKSNNNNGNVVIILHKGELTNIEKKWWRQHCQGYKNYVFIDPDLLKSSLIQTLRGMKEPKYLLKIIRIIQSYGIQTYDASCVSDEFIQQNKKKPIKTISSNGPDNQGKYIHIITGLSKYNNLLSDSQMLSLSEVAALKKTVIYSDLQDPLMIDLYRACSNIYNFKLDNVVFATIRKSMLDKMALLKNTISCSDVLYTYNNIMKHIACRYFMADKNALKWWNDLSKYSICHDKIYSCPYQQMPDSILESMKKYESLFASGNSTKQQTIEIIQKLNSVGYCSQDMKLYMLHKLGLIKLPLVDFIKVKQSVLETIQYNERS